MNHLHLRSFLFGGVAPWIVLVGGLGSPRAATAFTVFLVAAFGLGSTFLQQITGNHSALRLFQGLGVGFVLLNGASFLIVRMQAPYGLFYALLFGFAGVGVYQLIKLPPVTHNGSLVPIVALLALSLLVCLNLFLLTGLTQGVQLADGSIQWVNGDAPLFEAMVHQVKERLLPVTIPGFGIDPIYYYMGSHASAGLTARLFDLSPPTSFFLVTRAVGILAVLFSVFGIGLLFGRVQPVSVWPAVTGAFTFFFIGSPMATALISAKTEYWGGGGGAKHLRGFLIAHSSLWLCATLLPVMGTLLTIVREKQKCDLRQTVTLAVLAGAAVMTNLLAGIGSAGLLLWRVLFQNGRNKLAEAMRWRIGRALVVLTFSGLFLWLSGLSSGLAG